MMGGVNSNEAYGNLPNNWDVSYYIFKDGIISVSENEILIKKQFEIFTLEEFLEKYPYLDMVSIGPQMFGVHSPQERLSITSTGKCWEWLKAILTAL